MESASPLSGLCASCRYIEPQLMKYTVSPWGVAYCCAIRAAPLAPHAFVCLRYERDPGAD
jgi:hypothetical protein